MALWVELTPEPTRYGTGSGSDRAPVTRSLPLPVSYRTASSRTSN